MAAAAVIGQDLETDMKSLQTTNRKTARFILLGVMLATAVATAWGESDGIPVRQFEAQGIMQYVDLATGSVLIDKQRYQLAQNMKWYGLDSETSVNAQLLRAANKKVGYIVEPNIDKPTVKAIWILPSEGR